MKPGDKFSHYEIVKELGQGAMGEVFLARDLKLSSAELNLSKLVALKLLGSHLIADSDAVARFRREAIAAAGLNHRNIVIVYEMDAFEDRHYIAMEYVEGVSLKELLAKGPLEVEKAVEAAIQICEGLGEAHRAGIVHRDIKPENILLDKKGGIKIVDFGVAKLKGSAKFTQSGVSAGTIGYMSPEQLRGEKDVDQRTDFFSLGVVLYEILAARHPFESGHADGLIYSILYEEAEPLSHFNSQVPLRLQQIVEKALAKDPKKRYQNAAELLEDLQKKDEKAAPAASAGKKRLAVLPFENRGPDPENDFFCEGMTDDTITDLSKIEAFQVLGRNAIARIREGETADIPALGKRLNVDWVLRGSVRRLGSQLKINVELVDVNGRFIRWAERYNVELSHIFKLQEEIAERIAAALKIHLSPKEKEELARKYKGNPEAYEYYLKARNYFYKFTKADLLNAVQLFKAAIEIDLDYALAYAGLADCYVALIDRGHENEKAIVKSILRNAEQAASTALDKDPLCAEACKALGLVYYKQWRFQKAKEQLSRALELNPNYAAARADLGVVYTYLGDFERAEKERLRALEQDPSLIFLLWNLGQFYMSINRFAESDSYFRKVLALEDETSRQIGYFNLSRLYLYQKDFLKAREHLQPYLALAPDEPFGRSASAAVYAALGEKEKALAKLDETLKGDPWDEDLIENIIITYALLNDQAGVYDWIRKGREEHKITWVFLQYNPLLEAFRSEPEFQELLKSIKEKTLSGG